ncbi:---NA--- [Erysipelothrix amsterdamensis]|uniref:---NA n=1 Tax=Erysipelothrix amsterdamensis TaxID=2929157 RepID=A0AAU9VFR7_9FIRM|nr:hypothetical protein [Erysipelothrix rhusiopathiae]MDE8276489.1 hypothetical protein [Erysipelothrix rhusiopathiae]CAH2760418.1 ---NA--- [Erysipelothrix sp. A18Y020d]CAH2763709.1 hypothetical protein ERYAMS_01599 [Erysipelothrix sp. A18Y020d]
MYLWNLNLNVAFEFDSITTLAPYGIPNINQYIAIGLLVLGMLIVSNQNRLNKCIKSRKR